METTLRFVRSMMTLPDVRLGILSQEGPNTFTPDVRRGIRGFHRVEDALQPDQLVAGVRAIAAEWDGRIDRIVGVLEQLQEPLAQVRERLGIRGMDLREAHNFRDKSRMKELLRENGLPCARHKLATSAAEAMAFAEDSLPLVVKPPSGAGARNTMRVDSLEELNGYLRTIPPSPSSPLLLEEFIQGREHSFDSVSLNGQHVFHSISRYYPTPLEVMENPWLQWCVLLPRHIDLPEYDDIREAGRKALDVLGMVTGLTHMEWFRRTDGSLAISEVAARPPGAQFTSLISYAHDFDFYRAWARLMVEERFEAPSRVFAVGAVFLRGQGQGNVVRVHGLEAAQRELGELICQSKLPRPGQPPSNSYEGDGYVILRHEDTARVEDGLRKLLGLLRIELA